jgi:uncharacterized small protein (DUF1192 family)
VGIVLDLVGRLEAMEAEIERLRAELSRDSETQGNDQFPIGE